uniref:Uncharacterized protein n=1 Tax=Lepeophtheirus salmonis TaxID=72036 RepID=A0A0K2TK75_LEPSM
MILDSRKSDI